MTPELPFALTLGAITFLLVAIWGEPFVEILRRLRMGKQIRDTGPQSHLVKMGTPTMGGILIIVPVVLITLALNLARLVQEELTGSSILLPLFVLLSFGLLGAIDDIEGIRGLRERGEGIRARTKFAAQFVLALLVALVMAFAGGGFQNANGVYIPLFETFIDLPPADLDSDCDVYHRRDQQRREFYRWAGWAVGDHHGQRVRRLRRDRGPARPDVPGAVCVYHGRGVFRIPVVQRAPGADVHGRCRVAGVRRGAGHGGADDRAVAPAADHRRDPGGRSGQRDLADQLFPPDTRPAPLPHGPIHHHFELAGWSETQVVQRFWLVGILSAMLGVALALLR